MKKFAASLLALLLLCACAPSGEEEPGADTSPIYFLAAEAQGGDLLQESYERLYLPENASLSDTARAVVERLLAGPEAGDLTSPIPAGVTLEGLELRDGRAYVDLSDGFAKLDGVALSLADYCLTLSLTALEGVSSVSITAGGRPVGQQPKQTFYDRDVLLSDMDDVLQTVVVTLYFLNGEGDLTGERRTLDLYEGQTLAESLLSALLEGPQDRELTRAVPEDFQINFVRVENGVCTLNISQASLAALPEEERSQQLILWALADSLYSMETVEELRLLADGEELLFFGMIPTETVAVRPKG